jgi:hypothetical protein
MEAKYAAEQCKDTIYKDVVPIALANAFKSGYSASASAVPAIGGASAIGAPSMRTTSPKASIASTSNSI